MASSVSAFRSWGPAKCREPNCGRCSPTSRSVLGEQCDQCGVFGYVGLQTDVGETILTALKTLEYRGYDSWGLALSTPQDLVVHKGVGRINGHVRSFPSSTQGIGHTRWATH